MLPNYLSKIKSSGIYRFVWDKSEMPGVDTQTLRLVVGYSDKGPFNTPVYVENEAQFKTMFGDVNKKLERSGVFFHRNALDCLKFAPIYALNLKPFTETGTGTGTNTITPEQVTVATFNSNTDFDGTITTNTKVKNIFDTNRFWTLEPEKLDNIFTGTGIIPTQKYITISATDDKSSSNTFVIRSTSPSSYKVSFKDYFSQTLNGATLPEYLEGHEDDMMSDYFAEIYVFAGEWSQQWKASENVKKYFDPDNYYKIRKNINDAFGVPTDTLTVMASDPNTGFINKYVGILLPDFISPTSTSLSLDDIFNSDNSIHKMMMHLNANQLYENDVTLDEINVTLDEINTTGWMSAIGSSLILTNINVLSASGCDATKANKTIDTTNNTLPKFSDDDLNKTFNIFELGGTTVPTDERKVINLYSSTELGTGNYVKLLYNISNDSTDKIYKITETQKFYDSNDTQISVPTTITSLKNSFSVIGFVTGDRFLGYNGSPAAVKYISTLSSIDGKKTTSTTTTIEYEYTFNNPIGGVGFNPGGTAYTNPLIKCLNPVGYNDAVYKETYLSGFTYNTVKLSNTNKDDKINSILDVLYSENGIRIGLTDNVSIEYHYLVDTFGTYADANGSNNKKHFKNKLAMIAKEKDNCLALLNWPSYENIKNNIGSIDTAVTLEYLKCNTEYQSWVEYVTPLKFKNLYTGNKFEVPGAADLSNNYIEKFNSRYPYSIVAGPNNGVIANENLVGPDFNYSRAELDLYEPYGVNCFVYKPRKGTYINSQQTAKQKPVTTLSKVNVRELVIYLQDEIEKLLTDYQWEFNTQSLRDTVKSKADVICEQVKNNGGIYDYQNVCDESNNTDDVINNEMFVISTSIEPGMGAGKMVQELTIYRKGGMSSIIK